MKLFKFKTHILAVFIFGLSKLVNASNLCEKKLIDFAEFDGVNKMIKIQEVSSELIDTEIDKIIFEILSFQKSFIVTRNKTNITNGFLISEFDPIELKTLIHHGAHLLIVRIKGELAGYSLITHLEEFTDLYKDSNLGNFITSEEVPTKILNFKYLYQIAVSPKYGKLGIGTALLAKAAEISPEGLLADILTEPLNNQVSISFFKKNNYRTIGTLILSKYRDFGRLKSEVLLWKPKNLPNIR